MKELLMDATETKKAQGDYDRMVAAMQTVQHAAAVDLLLDTGDVEMRATLSAGPAQRPKKSGAGKQAL